MGEGAGMAHAEQNLLEIPSSGYREDTPSRCPTSELDSMSPEGMLGSLGRGLTRSTLLRAAGPRHPGGAQHPGGVMALQEPGTRGTMEPGREKSSPAPGSLQRPLLTTSNTVPTGERGLACPSPFSQNRQGRMDL